MEGAGPGALVAGRYRLESPIGEGGFGAVFRARDLATNEAVALKVLLRSVVDLGPRFRREAELAMRLSHPNTVRTLDAGEDPRLGPYIALELLEGTSLEALLRTQGGLAPRRVADVALAVLGSLEEAHGRGIVHRDIKPANVFLVRSPAPAVKVLDFGIAKSTNAETRAGLTREGQTVGTPAYMAPEQVTGGTPGPETDLYALGLLIAEALTGQSVFAGREPLSVLIDKLDGKPVPLPDAVRAGPLGPVVERAVAHAREARWPSAAAMRAAIEAAASAMPDETLAAGGPGGRALESGPTEWGGRSPALPRPATWASTAATAPTGLAPRIEPPRAPPWAPEPFPRRGVGSLPAMGPSLATAPRSSPSGAGFLRGCLLGLGIVAAFVAVGVVAAVALLGLRLPDGEPRRRPPPAPAPPRPPRNGAGEGAESPAPRRPRSARQVPCARLAGLAPATLNASIWRAGWGVGDQSTVQGEQTVHSFDLTRGDAAAGVLVFFEGAAPHVQLEELRRAAPHDAVYALSGDRLLFVSAAGDPAPLLAAIC